LESGLSAENTRQYYAFVAIATKPGSGIGSLTALTGKLVEPLATRISQIRRHATFTRIRGPGALLAHFATKLTDIEGIPPGTAKTTVLPVGQKTALIRKLIASAAIPLKLAVNSNVMVKGSAISGNTKTAGALNPNINENGVIEKVCNTQAEILAALENIRLTNKPLLESILDLIVPTLMELPPADIHVVAAITALKYAASISDMSDVALVAERLGIVFQPFYIVKTTSGYLFPIFEGLVTALSSSTNAYVDYGEPDIQILDVTVYKIERNNTKRFLATKPVSRYTTVKALLDQIKDAYPNTRCLVSSGGMFVTSLDPSAYYTSFHLLGIKHQSLELELI
jgi:hypothetical protein